VAYISKHFHCCEKSKEDDSFDESACSINKSSEDLNNPNLTIKEKEIRDQNCCNLTVILF
jgi:hypothetical protein